MHIRWIPPNINPLGPIVILKIIVLDIFYNQKTQYRWAWAASRVPNMCAYAVHWGLSGAFRILCLNWNLSPKCFWCQICNLLKLYSNWNYITIIWIPESTNSLFGLWASISIFVMPCAVHILYIEAFQGAFLTLCLN